jgi:hypothetical protein
LGNNFLKPPGHGLGIAEEVSVFFSGAEALMMQNLARSPLTWSIGGVGAIAIALGGLSYLGQGEPATPASEITFNHLAASPWQHSQDLGWQAAVAAQSAQTQTDWQRVADLWGEAIAALENVPAGDDRYAQAQAKIQEYRSNRAIATTHQVKAGSGPASAAVNLPKALANAQPAFTFTPGPAPHTLLGQSADSLARIELTDHRATLILPRSQPGALTMAQVVYARQFLAIAAPQSATQPWLLESLRDLQRNQTPSIPADALITLDAGSKSLAITVVTGP